MTYEDTIVDTQGPAVGTKPLGALNKYGRDLTKLAMNGLLSPAIGREVEIGLIAESLRRRSKSSVVLVGAAGVGKTQIVEQLAIDIVGSNCPEHMLGKSLIELDLGSLIAGTTFRGQFETRLKEVIEEVSDSNVIIFIDELHNIMGLGGGSMDASNLLKPALARGGLQLIGATTASEYTELEKDKAFKRRFTKLNILEPTREDTELILLGIKNIYEEFHNVSISPDIVKEVVRLAGRYINDRHSPDKEIDIIDLMCARVSIKNSVISPLYSESVDKIVELERLKRQAVVDREYLEAADHRTNIDVLKAMLKSLPRAEERSPVDIVQADLAGVISSLTGIDIEIMAKSDMDRLLGLEKALKESVIGQDEAVSLISKAIRRSRLGASRSNKPEYVAFMLGATGTGKTHLAKTLAKELYKKANSFRKIDMSEYMDQSSITKLIGAPPSFVGYEDGNHVFEEVRMSGGRMVILLDEIEKAHPKVLNLFLQIFDEGKCHDSKGNEISFKESVIIMTSNLGVTKLRDFGVGIGFHSGSTRTKEEDILMTELKKRYSPEVVNRFDDVIIFNPLTKEGISAICNISIDQFIDRMANLQTPYNIVIDDTVREHIAEVGFSAEYGGRFLNRTITKVIEDEVTTFIFEKNPTNEISLSFEDGKIKIYETQ